MLPLWRDRLKIVLAPDHVTLVQLQAGFRQKEVFNKTTVCPTPASDEPLWQPAMRALRQLLQQVAPTNADAEIILSNHFARFQLVKAQADLTSVEEEQGYVRFSFAEIYGREAEHWSVRWSSGLDIAPQLASAVDIALINKIENILAEVDVKLISLQPYFMAAFNHVRKSIDAKASWFVLAEPGRFCIAMLKDGDWVFLNTAKLTPNWAADLPKLIGRELQRVGLDNVPTNYLLCLPGYFDHKQLVLEASCMQIITMLPETLQQGKVSLVASVGAKQ